MLTIILAAALAWWPQSSAACLKAHEMAHAGGWGASHPNAIYTKECGHLPMPPKSYPVKVKPVIKYVGFAEMQCRCSFLCVGILGPGRVQACSSVGGSPAQIYLPKDAPAKSVDAR